MLQHSRRHALSEGLGKQTNQKRTNMDRDMTKTMCRKTDGNEAGKLMQQLMKQASSQQVV